MNTEQKKKLLQDVQDACRAVGRILDGPNTSSISLVRFNAKALHDECLSTLAGLCILEAALVAEIGTDNL